MTQLYIIMDSRYSFADSLYILYIYVYKTHYYGHSYIVNIMTAIIEMDDFIRDKWVKWYRNRHIIFDLISLNVSIIESPIRNLYP